MVILVVDDSEDVRNLYRLTLETAGYQVIQASDGKEAIRAAAVSDPDVILMDLNMPDVDGLVATAALRSIATLKHVPIVAMTAYPGTLPRQKALAAGCNAYLEKPFSLEGLTAILQQFSGNGPGRVA
jgi:two-component system cell cycle response regulator DivK